MKNCLRALPVCLLFNDKGIESTFYKAPRPSARVLTLSHAPTPKQSIINASFVVILKAVVKRKNPRTPAFQPFIKSVSHKNSYMRYNVCTNWEPPYAHKHPCSRRARTKLEWVIAQIDRAVPLKVRACEGTSEGSPAEGLMLEHTLCRSNSSSEKSALAATPQIGGNPALDL